MRVLHLVLKSKWYDMIEIGIKKFQDKNKIEISEAQLYSANLIYNDRAK